MKRICVFLAVLCGISLPAAPAQAFDQSSKWQLAKLVPADSVVYLHSVHNPERDFLAKHWSHVWEALKKSGIDQDIKAMISAGQETEEQRAEFDTRWEKAFSLCKSVDWGDLTQTESVMFARSLDDFAVLFRPKSGTLETNIQALVVILEELASVSDDLRLEASNAHGGKIWSLRTDDVPYSLSLFHRGEVVGLGIKPSTVDALLASMAGESKSEALVNTARYREAMSQLPPPEDSVTFVDLHKLMASVRTIVKPPPAQETNGEPLDEEDEARKIAANLLEEVDFIDYIAATEQTDGLKTLAHAVTKMSAGAKSKKLCQAIIKPKPISGVLQHVPANATGYMAFSGIDLSTLYSLVKSTITENFAEGSNWLTSWSEWQETNEFNLQKDVFSWIDGAMISMSFPPAIQTGFGGGGDFVMKIKVRDEGTARESISKHLNRFGEMLLQSPAADVHADGFLSISHPLLMMIIPKITVGVDKGWLYVSNSASSINKCLATAAGDEPSFATNERFKSEGIVPNGPINSASFSDTSNAGPKMAMAMGMGIPMLSMMIPPSPETKPLRSVFGMISKLAPVFAEMNFERSRSSVSRLEGDRWISQNVVNYKPYVAREEVPDLSKNRGEKSKVKQELEGL